MTDLFGCPDLPPVSTHSASCLLYPPTTAHFITHLFACPDLPPVSTSHSASCLLYPPTTAHFITHLFACPDFPPVSTHSQSRLLYLPTPAHFPCFHPACIISAQPLLDSLMAEAGPSQITPPHGYCLKSASAVGAGSAGPL